MGLQVTRECKFKFMRYYKGFLTCSIWLSFRNYIFNYVCVSICAAYFYGEIPSFLQTYKKGYEPLCCRELAFPCGSGPQALNLQVLSNLTEQELVQQGPLPVQVQGHLQGEQIVASTKMSCPYSKGEAPQTHSPVFLDGA